MPRWDEYRPWRPLYNTSRWKTLRLWQLSKFPFCNFHLRNGDFIPATVVDHVKKHEGDPRLFWSSDNLQSLCKSCHDGAKQADERRICLSHVNPEVFVLVGAPASGKSTWASRQSECVWFHLDSKRGQEEWTKQWHAEARAQMFRDLRKLHGDRRKIIVDTLGGSRWFRSKIRWIASDLRRPVTLVLWDEPLDLILFRNQGRLKPVPEDLIKRVHSQIRREKDSIINEKWHSIIRMDGAGKRSDLLDSQGIKVKVGLDGYPVNSDW